MAKNKNTIILDNNYFSENNNRKDIIDAVTKAILDNGRELLLSDEELYLVVDEAVTNAMEHGNKWNPKKVFIL